MVGRLCIALAAVTLAGMLATPAAWGRDPNAAKIAALQKQVKTLQRQVRLLQGALALNFEADTCLGAQTADLLQGTWLVIDQAFARTLFGPQAPVQDYGNCGDLSQPQVPRPGIVNPPRIDPLRPLLEWLHVPLR